MNDQILDSLKNLNKNTSTSDKMKADIDMQTTDWLALLVAQLKNQDMNNTMDTGAMMSQMAQFSQIQSMQNMVAMQESIHAMDVTSYAASLIGKEVTIAEMTTTTNSAGEKEDILVTKKGIVTGVTLFQGAPIIYMGDKPYSLGQIMIVGEVPDNPADGKPEVDPPKVEHPIVKPNPPAVDNTLPPGDTQRPPMVEEEEPSVGPQGPNTVPPGSQVPVIPPGGDSQRPPNIPPTDDDK